MARKTSPAATTDIDLGPVTNADGTPTEQTIAVLGAPTVAPMPSNHGAGKFTKGRNAGTKVCEMCGKRRQAANIENGTICVDCFAEAGDENMVADGNMTCDEFVARYGKHSEYCDHTDLSDALDAAASEAVKEAAMKVATAKDEKPAKAAKATKAAPAAPEVGTCSGVYLTSDPDTHVACTEPRASASNKLCKAHSKAYQAGTAKMSAKGAHAMVALVAAGVEVAYGKRDAKPAPATPKAASASSASKPAKADKRTAKKGPGDGSETRHVSTPPAPAKEPIARVKGTVAEAGHNGVATLVAVSA